MQHYFWKVSLKSVHLFGQTALDTKTYSRKMWYRLFYKMAAMTSSLIQIASNSNAHPLAYVRLFLESFVEIGPVVSPNGSGHTDRSTDTQTDRQTDTHTDRQTHRHLPFFPDTITIHLVNEMTKCKNVGLFFFFFLLRCKLDPTPFNRMLLVLIFKKVCTLHLFIKKNIIF